MTDPRLARGARITGAARDALVAELTRRYGAGESIRSMAADLGRSYGFVQGLLKDADVALRTRGGATRGADAEAARLARQEAVEAVRAELADQRTTPTVPVVKGPATADQGVVPVVDPAQVRGAKKDKKGKSDKDKKDKSDKEKKDKGTPKHKGDKGKKDAKGKDSKDKKSKKSKKSSGKK